MRFCTHCGSEIMDEAVICTSCGADFMNESVSSQTTNKVQRKSKKIWIILGAVAVFLAVVAAVLFVPRDLKMDDFKETNVVTAIIRYGIPEDIKSTDDGTMLSYDGIEFYGIACWKCSVYPEDNNVVFFFHSDDAYKVYDKIARYCDFEKDIMNSFHEFRYEDLTITTYDFDGSYVSIEIG